MVVSDGSMFAGALISTQTEWKNLILSQLDTLKPLQNVERNSILSHPEGLRRICGIIG